MRRPMALVSPRCAAPRALEAPRSRSRAVSRTLRASATPSAAAGIAAEPPQIAAAAPSAALRGLYPPSQPFEVGSFKADDLHVLYYQGEGGQRPPVAAATSAAKGSISGTAGLAASLRPNSL